MDFRSTSTGRRQRWYGLKRYVKRALGSRPGHTLLRLAIRARPELGRNGRLPAPAHLKEVRGSVSGTSFVMLRPDRCVIAKELYWGCGHRPHAEDDNALEIFASLARDADVMLDVGAYTGIFTLVSTAVNPALRADAFEIVPAVVELLRENCARNGVLDRVSIHHVGLGEVAGSVTLPVGEGGSALPDFYSTKLRFTEGVEVPIRTLDEVTRDVALGTRAVMKIDVEGTEAEILKGGAAFLERIRPDILCEVLASGGDGPALEDVLRPLGYRFFLVGETGVSESTHIVPDPRLRDWLFTVGDPLGLPS
jgi:FkbM family methyltransferase